MSSSAHGHAQSLKQLSFHDKLAIYPLLSVVYAKAFLSILVRVLWLGGRRPSKLFRDLQFSILRTLTDGLSPRQLHYLSAPTDDAYKHICEVHKLTPDSEVLEDGTTAFWLGSRNAEKILINFHGGGYVFPGSPAMVEFVYRTQRFISKDDEDVAVLFLAYDLAPDAQYPRQLQQAAALLHHTIYKLSKKPENIMILGDSAGGNLAMALLSHLAHPHPSRTVPIIPIELSRRLRGLVLISPWINFAAKFPSITSNKNADLITPKTLDHWSSAFMGSAFPHTSNTDYYSEAITAPESWWNGFMAEEILIVVGEDEIMLDSTVTFAEKLRKGKGDGVDVVLAPDEAHDTPSLDIQFGYDDPREGAKAVRNWISSRL